MPVYQYACTACGEQLEVRQSFTDDALTVCPVCAGRLRKVLSAVGVVFKGSGFYRTDSRTAEPAASAANGKSGSDANGSSESKGPKEPKEPKESSAPKTDTAPKEPKPSKETKAAGSGGQGASSGSTAAAPAH